MTPQTKQMAILFGTLIIVMMGFGMFIPVIPFLIEHFGASGSAMGALMAIYALMQLIFSPIWGELSDRIGRRPVLLIGLLGNGLTMLLIGLSTELWMLFAFRALSGVLASATMPTAMAFVGDSTTKEQRGGAMGMLSAAFGVGMVLGPGLGGIFAEVSLSLPFFVAAALSAVAMLVVFFFLPESLAPEARKHSTSINLKTQFGDMRRALVGPLGFLLFLAFLVSFGMTGFEGIFPLYVAHRFNFGPKEVGWLLTVVGVVGSLVQGGLTGVATRRWGETSVIKVSLLSSAVGFGLMLLANNTLTLVATVAFFVFSNAMIRPGVSSLTSKRAPMGQGVAMGLNNAFMSLGRVFGPLLSGTLFDINILFPYVTGGLVTLLGFILCLFLLTPHKEDQQITPVAVQEL